MLQQPTRVFQIIGKQILSDAIRFFLSNSIDYANLLSTGNFKE